MARHSSISDRFLKPSAAAALLGLTPREVRHLIETGVLPTVWLPGCASKIRRVRRSDVLAYKRQIEATFHTDTR